MQYTEITEEAQRARRSLCGAGVREVLSVLGVAASCVLGPLAANVRAQSPFATRVVEYAPAPGQFVQNPQFNDPARALGAPGGMGGLTAGDNTKVVSLGGFGGTITLGFDHSVWRNARNPRGMDFVVYGNGFFVSGDPLRRHGECGVIEVSRDDNANGLADDAWYLIPGSHLAANAQRVSVQWDASVLSPSYVPAGRSGVWSTSGYMLPFGSSPILVNANLDGTEALWGYADVGPTLFLGDTTATNVVDDPGADPAVFYCVPDDPLAVGVSPGSGGGAAISLAWAVDEMTGAAASPPLDRIDFVRITTAVNAGGPPLGEVSTEIGGVADVRAVYTPDWDFSQTVTVQDIFEYLNSWFAGVGEAGGADFNHSGATSVQDIFDFLNAWFAG